MGEIERWSYCPECGMVWQDGRAICEINGAGAETIPVDPVVGEELVQAGNAYAGAVEALRFYAQERGLGARLASDGGKRAREALRTMGIDPGATGGQ